MIYKQLYIPHRFPRNKHTRNEQNRNSKLKCHDNNYSMMDDKISRQNFKEKKK